MKPLSRFFRIILCFVTVFMIMSCSLTSGFQKTYNKIFSSAQNFSKVDRILSNPSAGLAELNGYHASLQQDVSGTLDGKAFERHTLVEITRILSSGDYDFIIDVNGNDIQAYHQRLLAQGDAFYSWLQSESDCQGFTSTPPSSKVIEPASLLLPILNATNLGKETINQVASVHYRFDQNSLPIAKDGTMISGDVWIAEQGGFVVKYTFTSPLPDKITGKDLETSQTWTYELNLVGPAESIALPPGCMSIPIGLPISTDAQNVARSSSWMTYNSTLSGRKILDLYLNELPPLGWELPEHIPQGDIKLPYMIDFSGTDQKLSLLLTENEGGGMNVDLLITSFVINTVVPTEGALEMPSGTPTPAATIDPAESGLPVDIPLYPGATDLSKMNDFVMFYASDAPDVVARYYKEQMTAKGWNLNDEVIQTDVTMQTWEKSGNITSVTLVVIDGRTFVNISLPVQN